MKPASEESGAARFALMLESACSDFETLARLVRNDVRLIATDRAVEIRAAATVYKALAKSFLFNVVRSRRICEHEAPSLKITREDRRRFLAGTNTALRIRDVNEHGFDPSTGGKISRPSMHLHSDIDAALDETSLMIVSDQRILIGPLNLYSVYLPLDRIRQIAGFQSLPRDRK